MNDIVTIKNYEEKRRELVEKNLNLHGLVMREDEKKVDNFLSEIKKECLKNAGNDIYDIPVLTDKNLINSRLYGFCSRLPKGADLHVHDMALLPFRELVKLLCECKDFCINADKKSFDLKLANSNNKVPDGYIRFCDAIRDSYYTADELVEYWTVVGAEKSGVGVWEYFEDLFNRQAVMSDNVPFAEKYYNYTFRYYAKKNIMHVEVHIMLTESIDQSAEYIRAMRKAYYSTKKEYPYFTVRVIGAGVKADSENIDFTKKCFLNASFVQETVKDESGNDGNKNFLIGFDLVNEEDKSLPLKSFANMLLKVKKQYPDMKLYIHGGESLDAKNDNLIDAYLLGVSRVGHGLNLYRYPDLHSRYVNSEICLEVCPISNQRLGYTKDIRNHPATEYLRSGMAISLCSDDPAYMENETLTDDFFAGIIGWNLSLADLKQLGINSIMYSGLEKEEKTASLKAYKELWNEFISEIIKENNL